MTQPIRVLRQEWKVVRGWRLVEQHSSKNFPKAKVACLSRFSNTEWDSTTKEWIKRLFQKLLCEWCCHQGRSAEFWTQLFYSVFQTRCHVALVFCCFFFAFLAPVLLSSCQSTFILAAFSGGRFSFFFFHLCPSSIDSSQAGRQPQWFAKLVRGDELRMFKWGLDSPPHSPPFFKQSKFRSIQ